MKGPKKVHIREDYTYYGDQSLDGFEHLILNEHNKTEAELHLQNDLFEAKNHVNHLKFSSDHLKVTVYLESLEVKTEVTSPQYDWSDFLSNIGGVLGLFTGFSILSALEILELVCDLWAYLASTLWAGRGAGHEQDGESGETVATQPSATSSCQVAPIDE